MAFDPALRQIIASLKSSAQWDEELDLRLLRALWPKLIGEALAAATTAVKIEGGRVTVRVPDPAWKKQLLAVQPWLLDKLNEPWPNRWITEIRFTHEDQRR